MLDPVTGAIVVGSVGSLLGGIFGSASSSRTNQTNLKIAREQRAFDERMWNEQNAYNTPLEQLKRYNEAGINPYMALSQIGSGNASVSAGGQTAPIMENAGLPLAEGISTAGNSVANTLMQSASFEQQKQQALFIAAQTDAQKQQNLLSSLTFFDNLKSLRSQYRKNSLEYKLLEKMQDNIIRQSNAQTSIAESNVKSAEAQARQDIVAADIAEKYGMKNAKVAYKTAQKQLTLARFQVFMQMQQYRMTEKQIELITKQIASESAHKILLEMQQGTERAKQGLLSAQAGEARAHTSNIAEDTKGKVSANELADSIQNFLIDTARQDVISRAIQNHDWKTLGYYGIDDIPFRVDSYIDRVIGSFGSVGHHLERYANDFKSNPPKVAKFIK